MELKKNHVHVIQSPTVKKLCNVMHFQESFASESTMMVGHGSTNESG